MQKNLRLLELPFFVILIGIYPVLSLLGHNISQVNAAVAIRPMLVSLLLAVVLWGILFALLRDRNRSALIAAVVLILFFTYGHLYNTLSQVRLGSVTLGNHLYLIAFAILILAAAVAMIFRAGKNLKNLVQILNIISFVLLFFPVYQVGDYSVRSYMSHYIQRNPNTSKKASQIDSPNSSRPDIYYIILDSYSREDVLKLVMNYDNEPFLNDLEQLGFTVPRCSQSNFSQTVLSIASSLNMNYLQALGDFPKNSYDDTQLIEMIEHSAARSYLEQFGYKTVAMSAFRPVKIESADYYISTDVKDLPDNVEEPLLSPFEAMVVKDTALSAVTDLDKSKGSTLVDSVNNPYTDHIRQQRYILNKLKEIPDIPGPKFVFVHIQIPHPPYVFAANGDLVADPPPFPEDKARPVSEKRINELYAGQVQYINARILDILKNIINRPGPRPVIILQGDHGLPNVLRMPILNAYYLPEGMQKDLYPQISPVNTFRYVFDHVFGSHFEMLDDVSYQSKSLVRPYMYTIHSNTRQNCTINNTASK